MSSKRSGSNFRLPPGTSIQKILDNQQAREQPPAAATSAINGETRVTKPNLADAIKSVMDKSRPSANVTTLPPRTHDDVTDGFMVVRVVDIDPYDGNMRLQPNPENDQIKASLRATGVRGAIEITRRPGTQRWIVAAGANTRLALIKELYEETGEQRFEEIKCTTVPYRDEIELLVNHINENSTRGETCFWENACANQRLLDLLEHTKGNALSTREFEAELKQRGMKGGRSLLLLYRFAQERLASLRLTLLLQLAIPAVRELQPAYTALRDLLAKVGITSLVELHERLDEANTAYADHCDLREEPLDPLQLVARWHDACARQLGSTRFGVRAALAFLASPNIDPTEAELRAALARSADVVNPSPPSPPRPRSAPIRKEPQAMVPRLALTDQGELLTRSVEIAGAAARAYGLDECVHAVPALPLGYYVELPVTALPVSKSDLPHPSYVAWWLLAYVSLQARPHVAAQLPAASRYRAAILEMDGESSYDFLLDAIGPELTGEDLMGVLTFLNAPPMSLLVELLTIARTLRNEHPERFAFTFRAHHDSKTA
jgi:8-oxo-dGTP pyrophosphatase MutT (NUDIX family)